MKLTILLVALVVVLPQAVAQVRGGYSRGTRKEAITQLEGRNDGYIFEFGLKVGSHQNRRLQLAKESQPVGKEAKAAKVGKSDGAAKSSKAASKETVVSKNGGISSKSPKASKVDKKVEEETVKDTEKLTKKTKRL
jgi:hypothetical protein